MTHLKSEKANPYEWLVVDVDNTLLETDLLYEAAVPLFTHPFRFARLLWASRASNWPEFKFRLAELFPVDPNLLPYNKQILSKIASFGPNVMLASGSPTPWISAIAAHLSCRTFLSSDRSTLLKGFAKLEAIRSTIKSSSFAYAGDSRDDLPIWDGAAQIIAVNPGLALKVSLRRYTEVEEIRSKPPRVLSLLKALRVDQWVKNLIILLPAFTGVGLYDSAHLSRCALTIVSFSFLASTGYIINDLVDLNSDRSHSEKRLRPIASGAIGIQSAIFAAIAALILGLSVAHFAGRKIELLLLCYFILNLLYSTVVKRIFVWDLFLLSAFYLLRILAGELSLEVNLTLWYYGFFGITFLQFAVLKRYNELVIQAHPNPRRPYHSADSPLLLSFGIGCGLLATLLLLLYTTGPGVSSVYHRPNFLALLSPLYLLYCFRIWLLANRRKIAEHPLAAVIAEPTTYIMIASSLIILALARSG